MCNFFVPDKALNRPHTLVLAESAAARLFGNKDPMGKTMKIGPEPQNFMGISIDEFAETGGRYGMLLQPLTGIHLDPEVEQQFKPPHDKKYIYNFSLVGIAILLIAAILIVERRGPIRPKLCVTNKKIVFSGHLFVKLHTSGK